MNVGSSQTAQAEAQNELSAWHSVVVNNSLYVAQNVFCVKMVEFHSLSLMDITQRKVR